jgi:serine/threonine-protein kinase RsbW
MKDRATITVPSHPKFLSLIREVTGRMARIAGADVKTAYNLKLAVDEACSNVIRHVYKGVTDKKIAVKYKITRKTFEVTIEDSGAKSDPGILKRKRLRGPRAGGLGVHFIRKAFDECCFDEEKASGNRLKLVKNMETDIEH